MRSKRAVSEWFSAVLRGNLLTPARGCLRRVFTIADEITETATKESHRFLTANMGDRLLLCGSAADDIAIVEVKRIVIDGWKSLFHVRRRAGSTPDGFVHVLRLAVPAPKEDART